MDLLQDILETDCWLSVKPLRRDKNKKQHFLYYIIFIKTELIRQTILNCQTSLQKTNNLSMEHLMRWSVIKTLFFFSPAPTAAAAASTFLSFFKVIFYYCYFCYFVFPPPSYCLVISRRRWTTSDAQHVSAGTKTTQLARQNRLYRRMPFVTTR